MPLKTRETIGDGHKFGTNSTARLARGGFAMTVNDETPVAQVFVRRDIRFFERFACPFSPSCPMLWPLGLLIISYIDQPPPRAR